MIEDARRHTFDVLVIWSLDLLNVDLPRLVAFVEEAAADQTHLHGLEESK